MNVILKFSSFQKVHCFFSQGVTNLSVSLKFVQESLPCRPGQARPDGNQAWVHRMFRHPAGRARPNFPKLNGNNYPAGPSREIGLEDGRT